MEPIDRIFKLADEKFVEQRDFAKAIGVAPSIVSQWRNGITKSYERRLAIIAKVLNTTTEYLLTGEKKLPPISEDRGQVQKLVDELNKFGINVDTLSESEISKIAKLAKTLFEE